jgi:hypothetical protein
MTKTSKLSRLFKFLWLYQGEPNKDWDTLLNLLMDKGKVTKIDEYTITFDSKYQVWICNHPYASGHWYNSPDKSPHCHKSTKIRLEDFVNNLIEETSSRPLKADIEFYKNKQ